MHTPPTPEDVHAEIPTRNNGEPFDATSRPTETQVEQHIATAVTLVLGELRMSGGLPDYDPDDDDIVLLHDLARIAATKKAASTVEYKHFPEQQNGVDSGEGASLYAEYRQAIESLKTTVANVQGTSRQVIGAMALQLPAVAALRYPDSEGPPYL